MSWLLIQFTIPISIHLELTLCSYWWIKGLLGKMIPTSLWQKPGPGQESSAKWFFVFCRKKKSMMICWIFGVALVFLRSSHSHSSQRKLIFDVIINISHVWCKFICPKYYKHQLIKFGFSEKATKFEKNFVVLLTRASCSVGAKGYLSKSRRIFLKTNVDKSYYTNFNDFKTIENWPSF